jgi:hypothetical protein
MENILEKLKAARKRHIEKKESSSLGGGGSKANITAGGQPLDFERIGKESLDTWKKAMEEEEAIPQSNPWKAPEDLRVLLGKLD